MITVGQIRELIKDSKDEDFFVVTSNLNVATQAQIDEANKAVEVVEPVAGEAKSEV